MERLRDNPADLEALVGLTAEALGISASYVEKDFWVAEVLRKACQERRVTLPDGSSSPVTFTFKGGTSLSRVFGIIERFSEDVDLLAIFPTEATPNARHKVLKAVNEAVRVHLDLGKEQVAITSSTTGVKRYTTYLYPTGEYDGALKEGVLLELGSRGGVHPSAVHEYRSLAALHAITELGESESTWEEFTPFSVCVLSPERTLLEKLSAVHDAASRNDAAALRGYGRHFYDIARLLQSEQVVSALTQIGAQGIVDLVADIEQQSLAAGFSSTARPQMGYASSPAFDTAHASQDAIEVGIDAARPLVHGAYVSLADVIEAVVTQRDLL